MSELLVDRFIAQKHYKQYVSWWTDRGKNAPEVDRLSTLGVVVSDTKGPLAMSFGYLSNSRLAQIGFTATNPKGGLKARIAAVTRAVSAVEKILKDSGVKYINTFSDESALSKLFLRIGYEVHTPHNFLIKNIGA